MKRISMIYLAAALSFAACGDGNSSTIGSYENDETETKKEEHVKETTTVTEEKVEQPAADTSKTTISVGKDGADFESKKGTGVSVDKKEVKVKTKKVEVEVKH